jgi:ankyrin repeat protein
MDNNFQEAKRLLEEHRQSLLEQRPPSRLSRKPTEGVYTYKEINHVLTQVIERNGPSGLVDALLSLGGDVNLSRRRGNKIWNLVRGKGQQPERNDILLKATANSSAEVVHSLARRADQDNLNSALHVALLRGDLAILKALLVHGADPADHHTEFEDVARQNNLDILDALLSGVKKPCLPCRSSALHIALRNGSSDALRMLMKSGADPNHDGATALSAAAEVLRPDLFAILLSGPTWPAPASLDTAVGRAYMAMQGQDTDAGREIIDMGLSASAQGPFTDDLFTEGFPRIVQSGQLRLLDTLLKFNKPSGHYETVTILQAMEIGDKQLLVKLLNLGPAPTSLALAVAQAMKLSASASRNDTIKILISSGAQGECIANALITTVQLLVGRPASTDQDSKLNRELFDLLLREGRADINYRGGEALQVAVRALALDISLQIASQRPSPDILGAALQVALSIQDAEMKESMVELLMGNDIADSAVNRSLMEAVRAGPGNSYLVQILLSRANVDYNSGEVFTYAIRHRDVNTLQLLLLQHPNSRSLSTAVDAALSLDRQGRHGVFEVLIPHLNREHLSHAFRASGLGASNPDLNFMRMLLQAGAAVTVDNGACIKQAARNLDIDALVLLAEFSSYNEGIYTAAFAELLESGNHWLSSDHLDAVQLILSHGASGPVLNTALFTVIDHLAGDEAKTHLTRKLLEMLLAADVNVNHDSGKVIRLAAKKGDVGVLRQLLNSGASTQTASFALSTAILAGHAEQKLLKLVDTFTNKEGAALNVDMPLPLPGKLPPLFLCLQAYPKSTSLVDRMFSAGCNPEQTVESRVYGEKKEYEDDPGVTIPDEEPLSVIQWALLQPNSRISSDVINTIINYASEYLTSGIRT